MKVQAYARDALYIPIHSVSEEQQELVERRFSKTIYNDERVCEQCDMFSERPCDVCDTCANFGGIINLWSKVELKDDTYLRLPYGARKRVEKVFGPIKVKFETRRIPMKVKPKFTGKLRTDQALAVQAMIDTTYGVMKSPPRSGKTVMGAAFVCELGYKTIILAAQKDWLDGFQETFIGSESQEALTNIKKHRIGFPKTLEDFEKYDVCLVTYQKFINKSGKRLLRKVKRMFTVLLVDEVQTVGAKELASVVSQFVCRYKIGVSGMPERKDCVSGDTLVLTSAGSVPISSLKVGDLVHTRYGYKKIIETHKRPIGPMVRITHETGYIDCTPDHKLWSKTRNTWVCASELTEFDELDETFVDQST